MKVVGVRIRILPSPVPWRQRAAPMTVAVIP